MLSQDRFIKFQYVYNVACVQFPLFYILFSLVFLFLKEVSTSFYIHCFYHIGLPWLCCKNIQNHKTFVNHSSQVSEIRLKTSNLKVTLKSVFHILRLVFRTKDDVCLQMYGNTVHVDIVEELIYSLYFRGFLPFSYTSPHY